MTPIDDHPQRYALMNELHARPFPQLEQPCQAVYVAVKQPQDAHNRDRQADLDHLVALLDRHGGTHPAPLATHYATPLGKVAFKSRRRREA